MPDGNFLIAPYPNPEEPKVFQLALEMEKEIDPDIIIGREPKMKIYCSVIGNNIEYAEKKLQKFKEAIMDKVNSILG